MQTSFDERFVKCEAAMARLWGHHAVSGSIATLTYSFDFIRPVVDKGFLQKL